MSVNEYLERARRHETAESWGEALYLYERAIERLDEEGTPDPALYSRAGDLQIRLNRPADASGSYEQAVELYVRTQDLDNAFAVCQKVLRHLPEIDDVYLRIARIRAMQGYTEWARQHYLTYAQTKGSKGDRDSAMRALEELVSIVPEDVDTRVFVSERLVAEGRRQDALKHLKEGHQRALAAQDRRGVQRLRERILGLDPHAALGELPSDGREHVLDLGRGAQPSGGKGKKTSSLSRFLGALIGRSDAEEAPRKALDLGTAQPQPSAQTEPAWASSDTEDEPASRSADPAEHLRRAFTHPPVEETVAADSTPPWKEERPVDESAPSAEELAGSRKDWELQPAEPVEQVARRGVELPPREQAAEPERPALVAKTHSAFVPPVPVPTDDDVLAAEETEVLRLLAAEPFEVKHHERFVRYAAKRGEPDLLIEGLFHMAIALRAAGLEWRSKSTLARILSMEPHNQRALEALGYGTDAAMSDPFLRGPLPQIRPSVPRVPGREAPVEPTPEPVLQPAAAEWQATPDVSGMPELVEATAAVARHEVEAAPPDGGYIDLAAMILDEPNEPSTRWQVEHEPPKDDEEADFGQILAQFKEQVSQHLERSDARAHYDLGSAYKGMGLTEEAIAMFQKALRAEPDFLPAIEMLGRCFIDNGETDAGINVLNRGLDVQVPVEDDLLGVYYYLANAYELQGKQDTAKDFYMKVFARDINFLDVTDRLRTMR